MIEPYYMNTLYFTLLFPVVILACHYIGDFTLQIPIKNMARDKKTDYRVCLDHCFIYTVAHLPLGILIFLYKPGFQASVFATGLVFIFGLHFLQDFFEFPTKILLNKARESKEWYPVLYVAVDNGYHLITNYLIGIWMLSK